ncbi:hypothetical protein INE81_00328 [Bacteroides salyersiae]|uniref:hypothetical protein n=1 Tax=Bacteroides salyersiae TaxID=291644 RepID=UPI001B8C01FB|nr:hypothetical protein [Bacteroides salyersiae]QUT73911.1 hypothetical protein INE81_00328 [Bacteroides salyersiae]
MNKIRCFFLFVFGGLLSATVMEAQEVDFEKEFDDFQKQQQKEFNNFKNKADADFETFLRETWVKFEAFDPLKAPVRPEPEKQPVFDGKRPQSPVEIKPVDIGKPSLSAVTDKPVPGIYVPGQPYLSVKIDVPVVPVTGRPIHRTPVNYYGSAFEIATDAIENLALAGNREADVADAWSQLCKADHEQLIKDCMTLREEKKMSDWAYLLFTKKIGEQLYGEQQKDDIAFLQMFILNKSGYKVRLSKINEKLKLMVAPAGVLYGIPYILLDGTKYYVFDAEKTNGPMGVYTYKQDFPNAKNYVSLSIDAVPKFDMAEHTESVSPKSGSVKVETVVNKNLMEFYKSYPQCDVSVYYHTPMSEELKAALYPPLQEAIKGKSQQEAANILIEFVQTGFEYQTDGDQFGYEKPFFLDENFFYPACDCEDRAILYSTLVKDLLGLDAVLLDYPNHIASAVRFTEEIPGDYVILDDGAKYLICDPTYIGASIGMCMEQFKKVSPQIIR